MVHGIKRTQETQILKHSRYSRKAKKALFVLLRNAMENDACPAKIHPNFTFVAIFCTLKGSETDNIKKETISKIELLSICLFPV